MAVGGNGTIYRVDCRQRTKSGLYKLPPFIDETNNGVWLDFSHRFIEADFAGGIWDINYDSSNWIRKYSDVNKEFEIVYDHHTLLEELRVGNKDEIYVLSEPTVRTMCYPFYYIPLEDISTDKKKQRRGRRSRYSRRRSRYSKAGRRLRGMSKLIAVKPKALNCGASLAPSGNNRVYKLERMKAYITHASNLKKLQGNKKCADKIIPDPIVIDESWMGEEDKDRQQKLDEFQEQEYNLKKQIK